MFLFILENQKRLVIILEVLRPGCLSGMFFTPGVVIDERVKLSVKIPNIVDVKNFLK